MKALAVAQSPKPDALKIHPLAEMFPPLTGEKLAQLAQDISIHGMREPIVLFEGKVLDGRNRLAAARSVGAEVRTRDFDGGDPLAFVVSANLLRRHLNEAQRALVAARIANCPRGGPRNGPALEKVITHREAAVLLTISETSVQRAATIVKSGTASLLALVEKGQISCFAAGAVARLPALQQNKLVEQGVSAISARARKHGRGTDGRNQYSQYYSCVDQMCDALAERRLDKVRAAAGRLIAKIDAISKDARGSKT